MTQPPPNARPQQLVVKCKACSSTFASPIQMDEYSLASAHLSDNAYSCPRCGTSSSYNKEDHFFTGPN